MNKLVPISLVALLVLLSAACQRSSSSGGDDSIDTGTDTDSDTDSDTDADTDTDSDSDTDSDTGTGSEFECNGETIPGDVTVSSYSDLEDLAGYSAITGNLEIHCSDCPGLWQLSCLESIGAGLVVESCDSVADLAGLENLSTIGGSLSIAENQNLTDIGALAAIEQLATLALWENPSLVGIDLYGLAEVEGTLSVSDNDSLTSLDGLSSLTTVGGQLSIILNTSLGQIDGLSALTAVGGDIFVNWNSALVDIDGLGGVVSVGGSVDVHSQASLASLEGLANITDIGGGLRIESIGASTELSMPALVSLGESSFGSISVVDNPALENVDLSAVLTASSDVDVIGNDSLVSLNLSALTAVEGHFVVEENASLTEIAASNLETVVGDTTYDVYLANNDALVELTGFGSLVDVGWIEIRQNTALTTVSAFANVGSLSGLWAEGNPALIELALDGLAYVWSLKVIDNDSLANLDGLTAISEIEYSLEITENDQLPYCEICDLYSQIPALPPWVDYEGNLLDECWGVSYLLCF